MARGVRVEGLAGDESANCPRRALTRQCSGEENVIPNWPLLPAHRIVTDPMRDTAAKPGGAREPPFWCWESFGESVKILNPSWGDLVLTNVESKGALQPFWMKGVGIPDPWTGDFAFSPSHHLDQRRHGVAGEVRYVGTPRGAGFRLIEYRDGFMLVVRIGEGGHDGAWSWKDRRRPGR